MRIWVDDYSTSYFNPTKRFNDVEVDIAEPEIIATLLGPDGKPLRTLVDNWKLPIGFQREPK